VKFRLAGLRKLHFVKLRLVLQELQKLLVSVLKLRLTSQLNTLKAQLAGT
jgi:hypothetical protein